MINDEYIIIQSNNPSAYTMMPPYLTTVGMVKDEKYLGYIPIYKHKRMTFAERLMQMTGLYEREGRYKEYLMSGINSKNISGVGFMLDHALDFNPLDRSYISQEWIPRIVKTDGYPAQIKLNAPNYSHILVDNLYEVDHAIMGQVHGAIRSVKAKILHKLSNIEPFKKIIPAISQQLKPLEFVYGEKQDRSDRRVTLFKNNTYVGLTKDSQQIYTFDPMSYQVQSYKTNLYSSQDKDVFTTVKNEQSSQLSKLSYKQGNVIKFWIQDVNNKTIMTTPAFISDLQDGGLQGEWNQQSYVGSMYPTFTYKGTTKRTIDFQLKLGCFSQKYLPQYIQKLNFLRLVGSPSWQTTQVMKSNKKETFQFNFPRAPIYKLTLGDVVDQQYGFFEKCDLSWEQGQDIWNLNIDKTYDPLGNPKMKDYVKGSSDIENDINKIQIPIITTIAISFTCMYGRGFDSNINRKTMENFIYKPKNEPPK